MRLKPCLVIFHLLLLSIVSTYITPTLGSDILRYKVSMVYTFIDINIMCLYQTAKLFRYFLYYYIY